MAHIGRRDGEAGRAGRTGRARRARRRWRDASLRTSFMAYMFAFLLAALAGSLATGLGFSYLQNKAIADAAEISGIYLYDAADGLLYPARSVYVATADLSAGRSVFVRADELDPLALADLPDNLYLEDISDYLYVVGGPGLVDGVREPGRYAFPHSTAQGSAPPQISIGETSPSETPLSKDSLPTYDAAARRRIADEGSYFGANVATAGLSEDGLVVSPVGYYLFEPASPEAAALSTALGLLSLAMFPLWFGLCIWLAARRFFRKRIQPALEALDGAAARIADRDLDFTVSYGRRDEMGRLADTFETMRASLAESQRTLWRTAEERRRLNAAFAHDLRTPLTVLHGRVELMQAHAAAGDAGPARLAADCEALAAQVARLEGYVAAMNGIQRLEDRTVVRAPVTMDALAHDVRAAAETLCSARDVTLAWDDGDEGGAAGGPGTAAVDRSAVLEVAENLVGNAARHATGIVRVRLTTKGDGAASVLALTVEDDGPGFSPKALRDGCKPFFSESKERGSFGLGLNIAHLLCEKHGGALELSNTPTGACATATFGPDGGEGEAAGKGEDR